MIRLAASILLIFAAGCGSSPRIARVDDGIISSMIPVEEEMRQRCARHGGGRVTLRLEVGNTGRIDRATLLQNTGERRLGFCAMAACARARFEPGPPFEFIYTFEPAVTTRRAMKVEGGLAPDVVWQGVNARAARIDECMEAHGAAGQRGEIAVRFSIQGTGAVRGARVLRSTLGNDSLERCVLERVSSLVFPAPEGDGNVDVSYTCFLKKAHTSRRKSPPTAKPPRAAPRRGSPPAAPAASEPERIPAPPLDDNPYPLVPDLDGGASGDF